MSDSQAKPKHNMFLNAVIRLAQEAQVKDLFDVQGINSTVSLLAFALLVRTAENGAGLIEESVKFEKENPGASFSMFSMDTPGGPAGVIWMWAINEEPQRAYIMVRGRNSAPGEKPKDSLIRVE